MRHQRDAKVASVPLTVPSSLGILRDGKASHSCFQLSLLSSNLFEHCLPRIKYSTWLDVTLNLRLVCHHSCVVEPHVLQVSTSDEVKKTKIRVFVEAESSEISQMSHSSWSDCQTASWHGTHVLTVLQVPIDGKFLRRKSNDFLELA